MKVLKSTKPLSQGIDEGTGSLGGDIILFNDGHSKSARELVLEAIVNTLSSYQATIEFELDGTIITANDDFLSILGYSLDEVQGKHHSMFVGDTFKNSGYYKKFWQALSRGEYQAAEYKRIGKGGKEVWLQTSYNPIFNQNGKPYKVVKYATDVTADRLGRY